MDILNAIRRYDLRGVKLHFKRSVRLVEPSYTVRPTEPDKYGNVYVEYIEETPARIIPSFDVTPIKEE